jgi:integrase
MAIHKLTPTTLNRKKPGLYGDGGGLWFQISIARNGKDRNRSWVFRWSIPDPTRPTGYRTREMGLGSADTITLAMAREKALRCRQLRDEGKDPIVERDTERAAAVAATARVMTFDQCTNMYLAAHRQKWRSQKHAAQWVTSLRKHASPVFGSLPVGQIDTALVMKALQRIWHDKPESGSRLRGRIESVLSWATVGGYRQGDNPARWGDHLEHLLPSRRELQPAKKLAALAYADVPGLMAVLRARQGSAARALEFLTLTASRTGEITGMRWDEIEGDTWVVPGTRMKAGREHVVPLCKRSREIIAEMRELRQNEFVFPGSRKPTMMPRVMERLLKRLGHAVTVHGMRAGFKTWASERTNFQREVIEASLAHAVGMGKDDTERSYQRGTFYPKRVKLMQAWSDYCGKPAPAGATITALHKVSANA